MSKINMLLLSGFVICIACTPTKTNLQEQKSTQNNLTSQQEIPNLPKVAEIPFDQVQITLSPLKPEVNPDFGMITNNSGNTSTNTINTGNNLSSNTSTSTNTNTNTSTNTNTNTSINTNTNTSTNLNTSLGLKVDNIDDLPDEIDNIVVLKKGSYFLDRSIKVLSGGTLKIEAGTVLEMDACGITCLGKIEAKGTSSANIEIKGVAWDNIIVSSGEGVFEYCNISGGSGMGVRTDGVKFFLAPENITTTFGSGILFLEAKGQIKNCIFSNSYGSNMLSFLFSDLSVESCTIKEYNEIAIYAYGGKLKLNANKLENQKKAGVVLYHDTNATIENNEFNNSQTCIITQDKSTAVIKNNSFNNIFSGIISGFVSNVIIEKNRFLNINSAAIVSDKQSILSITDNYIEKVGYGIAIGGKSIAKVINNTIKQAEIGILIEKTASAESNNNKYENCQIKESRN